MNLGGKQDLDALLKSWPAPLREQGAAANEQDEERNWEERADAIVRAALTSKQERPPGAHDVLDVLMRAPGLAPEPGEPAADSSITAAAGEKKMSQEKEPGDVAASTATPPPAERKRTSLKDIAARANQSGAATRGSSPGVTGVATPAPSSVAPAGRAGSAASTPLPRPVEAGKDDSGVINLDVVRATVTAQQLAAAEKAKPASAGLFEDEHTVESAHNPAVKAPVAKVTSIAVVKAKKNNAGPIAGVVIAALGMAAAFAIVSRKPPATAPIAAAERVVAPVATLAPVAPTAAAVASAEATAASPSATNEPDTKPADTTKIALVAPSIGGTAPVAKDAPAAPVDPKLAVKTPAASGKPGTLQEEMAHAVGSDGAPKADTGPVPEPASGPKNQNVPEQPPLGAVNASVNGVTGGAKACVAGADDVSRANLTFSSSGAVTSVSVTGWAAAHGKSACIQAALKGAKVGPFSRPSYTFSMTIRP